ncbi:MAG: acetyl-CoA carboxylase biotin carboxyl carrier protein, partial [Haemophilus parainfluenzae]|nr:acetyl-CoA carboxylase biotin carboxyl carrier protein [Haemophilus parainfluenzae]
MDIRKIKKLIELVEESGITELEVQEEEGTVRISRAAPAVAPAAIQYAAAPVAPVAAPAAPAPAAAASAESPAAEVSGHQVRSPM